MSASVAWLVCKSVTTWNDWTGLTSSRTSAASSATACLRCQWRQLRLAQTRRRTGLWGGRGPPARPATHRLRAMLDSTDGDTDDGADDDEPLGKDSKEPFTDSEERTFHDIPETSLPLDELQRRIRLAREMGEDSKKDQNRAQDASNRDKGERRSIFEVEATVVEGEETLYDPQKEVYVLVFRSSPRGDGIYSLRLGDEDIILAFERDAEALHYAHLLASQEFPEAQVEKLRVAQVYEFCEQTGLRMGLVPSGMMIVPPQDNMPGYERYFRNAPENGPPDREYVGELSERQLNELKRRLGRLVDEGSGKDESG